LNYSFYALSYSLHLSNFNLNTLALAADLTSLSINYAIVFQVKYSYFDLYYFVYAYDLFNNWYCNSKYRNSFICHDFY